MRLTPLFVFIMVIFGTIAARAETTYHFPKDFKWCVATSAHQIEGQNTASDWWAFEAESGRIKNGERSGLAVDHWNRVIEDTELIKNLQATDYRLSIEWAKIEPKEGHVDPAAIAHYRSEILTLLAHGIRPVVTLHHFTFPLWLANKGGWEWAGAPLAFDNYTRLVYNEIAPEATDWVTINEPMISTLTGYFAGVFPPAQKRPLHEIVPVVRGLLKAHAAAYATLHRLAAQRRATVRVGMAHAIRTIDPLQRINPLDLLAAHWADDAWNWALPEALESGRLRLSIPFTVEADERIAGLAHTQDFFGINYYTGDDIHFSFHGPVVSPHPTSTINDLGWPIYPKGLYRSLRSVSHRFPNLPILITENGIADSRDAARPEFIRSHLAAVALAIRDGSRVEGYCHWSLLDNFEWAEGFTPRFGLYAVDRETLARTPRPSALAYRNIIVTNAVTY